MFSKGFANANLLNDGIDEFDPVCVVYIYDPVKLGCFKTLIIRPGYTQAWASMINVQMLPPRGFCSAPFTLRIVMIVTSLELDRESPG